MSSIQVRGLGAPSAAISLVWVLSACSPMPTTTIDGPLAFHQHAIGVTVESALSTDTLAACFEETAGLLPGSTIALNPADGVTTYRLRAGRFLFESISISPRSDGGSLAVVEVSPDYKARMRADFVSHRLAPLYQCAGAQGPAEWPGQAVAKAGAMVSP